MHEARPAAKRRALRADARRNADLLREAATEIFGKEGIDTPLNEVAKRAGVSIGTLYNRFGGRAGLLDAVMYDVAQERLRSRLAVAREQKSSWSRFEAFVEAACEFQSASPTFSDDAAERYYKAARLLAVSETTLAVGEGLIRAAQEDGALRQDFTREDLYRVIWSQGSLIRDRVGEDNGWRRSVQFLLDGLREQTAPTITQRVHHRLVYP